MIILFHTIFSDVLLLLLLISKLSINITKATSTNDEINHIKRADECNFKLNTTKKDKLTKIFFSFFFLNRCHDIVDHRWHETFECLR